MKKPNPNWKKELKEFLNSVAVNHNYTRSPAKEKPKSTGINNTARPIAYVNGEFIISKSNENL